MLPNPYIIIGIIVIFIGLFLSGRAYEHKIMILDYQNKEQAQLANANANAVKITNKLNNQLHEQEVKNNELQKKMAIANNDLRSCKLNSNVVQYIYKSSMQDAKGISSNADTDAKSTTYSESTELTAQDLTHTLLAHDEMYFECKFALDAWQEWYKLNGGIE